MGARVLFIFIASLWASQIQALASSALDAHANYPDHLLAMAVDSGNIVKLHKSISLGAQVKAHSNYLYVAVLHNYPKIAEVLMQCGADVNVKVPGVTPDVFVTPLMAAAQNGNFEMVELLLTYGADFSYVSREIEQDGRKLSHDALSVALINGHEKIADLLIKCGAELDADVMDYLKSINTKQKRIDFLFYATLGVGTFVAWNLWGYYWPATAKARGTRGRHR